jgi:hypothetical protein
MYVNICIDGWMHVCMLYVCINVCVHTHTFYICTYMNAYMPTTIDTHTDTLTYKQTCMHADLQPIHAHGHKKCNKKSDLAALPEDMPIVGLCIMACSAPFRRICGKIVVSCVGDAGESILCSSGAFEFAFFLFTFAFAFGSALRSCTRLPLIALLISLAVLVGGGIGRQTSALRSWYWITLKVPFSVCTTELVSVASDTW